jgi:CubicO group peptidase (beta-lactamase class C family)
LFFAASTAKGIVSATIHCLLERGEIDEDLRVAEVWPEFAAMGKHDVSLRHVLDHTAGVPAPPSATTVADLCDWDHMCTALAAAEPWWEPGTRFGYHAITFGFLAGETVRRATGVSLSSWLRELLTAPLGLEDHVYFGVPLERHSRLVPQIDVGPLPDPAPASPAARAIPVAIRPDATYANDPRVLAAEIPSQGTMTALGAASVYAALLGHVPGLDVISPERRTRLSRPRYVGHDVVMDIDAAWADGFSPHRPCGGDADRSVFGMYGINGSGAYADLDRGVAVAVMRNRFDPDTSVLAGIDRIITDTVAPAAIHHPTTH